jgi:type II secretory pathway pseudopilin PulG
MKDEFKQPPLSSFILPPSSFRAFTLIEATTCLVILGVVMAIAAVNLRGVRQEASLESAIVELQQQDHLMRDRARRLGTSGAMVFDWQAGGITRMEIGENERRFPLSKFGESARVKAFRATSPHHSDTAPAVYCVAGRTPSYAVHVEAGGKEQWLVVAGLTGTFEKVNDERQVADIFTRLARHDAR